jgi:hypothetical protein
VALRHEGEYSYGDSATDVWDYFVWRMRNSPEPPKHWRQVVCPCGGGVFTVAGDEERGQYERTCTECETEVVMFEHEFSRPKKPLPDLPLIECICYGEEFEVVGVTAPFMGEEVSAKWFYLGLRCVECGCLGCYADWIPRYTDAEAYLAML